MKLLVLPGLDGTGKLTDEFRGAFPNEFSLDVVAYPPELSSYADIYGWLTARLPREDFVLVAESFSGPLAIKLGSDDIPNLRGIVFVATFAKAPRRLPSVFAGLLRLAPLSHPIGSRVAQPFLMGQWTTRQFTDRFSKAMRGIPKATLCGRLQAVLSVDVVSNLAEIRVPMIYLRASKDRLIPSKRSRAFSAASANVIEIEAPHFLLQAKPEKAAAIVKKFLEELSA